jgi:signal transduction histidine kinase
MRSLKRRAMAGAVLWTLLVFVIGVTAFLTLFDRIAISRFDEVLDERLIQATVALSYTPPTEETMSRLLVDPAYSRPYSGRYWQAENRDTGEILVSRSLFDVTLAPPERPGDTATIWQGPGPDGEVRALSDTVILENGSTWTVTVAQSVAALEEQRRLAANGSAAVFLFLGLLAVGASALFTRAVLKPLERLSAEIENRWITGARLAPDAYPAEIAPLVNDVNTLVERNHDIVARARRQAADLAHALKTPSAALRNELETAAESGTALAGAVEALDRIDAQLKRTLIRMRAEYASNDVNSETSVAASLRRLERLFRSSAGREDVRLDWSAPEDLTLPLNPQDFEEAVGNLMDNAYKWTRSRIAIEARVAGDRAVIEVHDDGPGVSPGEVDAILQPAYRIDTSTSGSGLGLAITNDLVRAYGGELEIGRSETLGGLFVRMRLDRVSQVRQRLRSGAAT